MSNVPAFKSSLISFLFIFVNFFLSRFIFILTVTSHCLFVPFSSVSLYLVFSVPCQPFLFRFFFFPLFIQRFVSNFLLRLLVFSSVFFLSYEVVLFFVFCSFFLYNLLSFFLCHFFSFFSFIGHFSF